MLTKGLDIGFKDIDLKQGIVKGQWCNHKNKDLGGDISEYGFSNKSVSERGPNSKRLIKFCLNHENKGLPGVLNEIWEEPVGGFYAAKAGTHAKGQDFLKMVESDIINQHSYGYKVIKETYDQLQKANILKEIYLYEISAIEFLGMNPETTFIEMKDFQDALTYLEKLDRFVRTSDATDETLQELELKLQSLSAYIKADLFTLHEKKADDKQIISNINLSFESWK
mgnify:CR=1 FL=1|tara:strand:+ start:28295 stop:28969 length:675 start_codon:yes stop_codon:yes gene_type:complete